jgi:hypoxanthine phosphoribosyltransferase
MHYTWETFGNDCKKLAESLRDYSFTHILSVERGGGYVTRELIKYYSRAVVVPIRVSFYDGQTKREKPLVEYPSCKVFKPQEKVLCVDDLLDSGETIDYIQNMHILEKVESVKTAVLLIKTHSKIQADYYVHSNISSWCVFPWEDAHGNHLDPNGVSYGACQAAG